MGRHTKRSASHGAALSVACESRAWRAALSKRVRLWSSRWPRRQLRAGALEPACRCLLLVELTLHLLWPYFYGRYMPLDLLLVELTHALPGR